MKIFIASHRRADTLTCPQWLEEGGVKDYTVVLHTDEAKRDYLRAGRIPNQRIVVSHQPTKLGMQRMWIEENLVEPGEWWMSLDDNIRGWSVVRPDFYRRDKIDVHSRAETGESWRTIYDHSLNARELMERVVPEMMAKAETIGASYCGFAVTDNFFFRSSKWLTCAFVVGKAFIRTRTGIPYDPEITTMDDLDQTARHLLRDGAILVNNFAVPEKQHYQAGGVGTISERRERKAAEVKVLCERWPGLFKAIERPGGYADITMAIDYRSLEKWRAQMFRRQEATMFDTLEAA